MDFVNQRLLEYTGLPLEDVKGWGWTAEWHPEDCATLVEEWRAALAAGEPFNKEARLRRADGEYRWFLLRAVPLRDELGNIVKWYGTTTDIEDRKRAEEALRRSEAYLAEAQRLSRTGSFGWNVSSGELFWSEENFRIFGYDRATKPTVQLVLQRVHPDDIALVQQLIERASHDGKDWDLEHRLLMPDGSVKHLHVMAHASRDESGNLEFMGAVMDVTAAKRAEEELHQARADLAHVTRVTTLGELTASIAHEVNQPIAAVITNADAGLRWLAAQPPDLEEARQALGRIINGGNRASEVIDRIRALVKKTPPRKDRLDINEIILEVIALTRSEVHRNRVALQAQLLSDLAPISGDRIQLQQVILNLIINAIEAMSGVSEGPREVLVGSGNDDSDGVLVAVHDSGPGLDAERLNHLFDAFYTTKPNGLGMGLTISRSIIEAHGGRLWATPNVPRGAILQFMLPADGEEVSSTKQTPSSS
jgi:PAS domain S-box-containing protein